MNEFGSLTIRELLQVQASSLEELRTRGVLRSSNKPVGDFGEYLFCRAFGWEITGNSQLGYDATDEAGLRYQIKARQVIRNHASERQLSALRGLRKTILTSWQGFCLLRIILFYGRRSCRIRPL